MSSLEETDSARHAANMVSDFENQQGELDAAEQRDFEDKKKQIALKAAERKKRRAVALRQSEHTGDLEDRVQDMTTTAKERFRELGKPALFHSEPHGPPP